MLDLHCHILPGIDDGPDALDGSLRMAREHLARGVTTVVATPHVSWNYANSAATIGPAVDALRSALRDEGIPLTVHAGAELALTRAIDMDASELAALRLAGSRWVLLEAPISVDSPGVEGMIGMVQGRGSRILLAHPERCAAFHGDPDLLRRLVASGCRAQVTAGALLGTFGRTVQTAARRYLDEGLIHVVASDAHDLAGRPPGLREPILDAGYAPLADWLTVDVPTAMLAGRPIPPQPAFEAPRARRWPWRRAPR